MARSFGVVRRQQIERRRRCVARLRERRRPLGLRRPRRGSAVTPRSAPGQTRAAMIVPRDLRRVLDRPASPYTASIASAISRCSRTCRAGLSAS